MSDQHPPEAAPATLRCDLHLSGETPVLREAFSGLLNQRGWTLELAPDGWSGKATKGSRVANVLVGAFAQYHEVAFAFSARGDGTTSLSIYRAEKGYIGGLWGMSKVKKAFGELTDAIQQHFEQTGALIAASGH